MLRMTASSLPRIEQCPASASLPQVGYTHADAAAGHADHAVYEAQCPSDEEAEVPMGLNIPCGTGFLMTKAGHRNYGEPAEGIIYGTTDRLKVEADRVIIRDYKSGHGYLVARAAENVQLHFYAVAAALAYGKDAATVEVVQEGRKPDAAYLGPIELDLAFARIKRIWQRASAPNPEVVTGPRCWRCPAFARCPAQTGLALALANGLDQRELPTLELTPEAVRKGWKRLKEIRAVIGAVEAAYRGYAALSPVALDGGKTLGPVESSRETLDGKTALRVLTTLHGREVAEAACEVETSKAAIERALKTISPRGTLANAERKTLDAIRAESGITLKTTQRVEEY